MFPLPLILINAAMATFCLWFILGKTRVSGVTKIALLPAAFLFFWMALDGSSFMPEPYITLLLVAIYVIREKEKENSVWFIGIILGLIFLIKFNAAFLIGVALFVSWLLEEGKINFQVIARDTGRLLVGALLPLIPFLLLFHKNYQEVYFWLFRYNKDVVIPLARLWPPGLLSLFFLVLLVDITAIAISLKIKMQRKNIFLFLSSAFLVVISYPRYGDSHLLPSFIGFCVGIIVILKEKKDVFNQVKEYQKVLLVPVIAFAVASSLLFTATIVKKTIILFIPDHERQADFGEQDKYFINNLSGCHSIYISPPDVLMYMRLPEEKRSFFVYANFPWTFPPTMQQKISEDITKKKISCFIYPLTEAGTDPQDIIFSNFIKGKNLKQKIINWDKDDPEKLVLYY